jgi:hypothetical protein
MVWTTRVDQPPQTAETPLHIRSPLRTLKILFENTDFYSHPSLLDMGPPCGQNIELFGQKGFKVYVEDFLSDYVDPVQGPPSILDLMNYPPSTFDGLICWDIFDYIPPEDSEALIEKLFLLLREGGMAIVLFDARTGPHSKWLIRHKIVDENEILYEPIRKTRFQSQHYQNRKIMHLFHKFEIVKSYYHKNQVREYLFQKVRPETS